VLLRPPQRALLLAVLARQLQRLDVLLALQLLLLQHLLLERPAVRDSRVLPFVLVRVPLGIAPLLAVVLAHLALDLVLVMERRAL